MLGRSKTYILGATLSMSVIIFLVAPLQKGLLDTKNYPVIVWLWFFINFFNCFLQIASEAWCVTILEEKYRPKATIVLSIGQTLGVFACYNIFMPLNSVKWVNKYLFTRNPVKVTSIFR